MARDFTDILSAVWAANALTTIPNPPIPGQAYRNTEIDDSNLENGQQYSEVYDSARYNQLLYLLSGCLKMLMETGIPEWSAEQNYQQNAYTIGSDGKLYGPAKKASGPDNSGAVDPVTDAAGEATTWTLSLPDFEAPLAFDAAKGKVKLSVGNTTRVTGGKLETKIDPNGGLRSSAAGVSVKPVSGSPVTVDANGVNVSTFTPPTADGPGKAGLVPQPQATDPSVQINNILTMQGWKKISSAAMIPDEESGELIQGMDPLLDPVDLNDIYSGNYYLGNITANAPNNEKSCNLLAWRTEVGTTFQMFITQSGIHVRGSTTDTGQFVWNPWTVIGAPRPTSAKGVGKWDRYDAPVGTNCTLPAEGVWAYHIMKRNIQSTGVDALYCGVAAGGTIIDTQADSTVDYAGLVWQVSA